MKMSYSRESDNDRNSNDDLVSTDFEEQSIVRTSVLTFVSDGQQYNHPESNKKKKLRKIIINKIIKVSKVTTGDL